MMTVTRVTCHRHAERGLGACAPCPARCVALFVGLCTAPGARAMATFDVDAWLGVEILSVIGKPIVLHKRVIEASSAQCVCWVIGGRHVLVPDSCIQVCEGSCSCQELFCTLIPSEKLL